MSTRGTDAVRRQLETLQEHSTRTELFHAPSRTKSITTTPNAAGLAEQRAAAEVQRAALECAAAEQAARRAQDAAAEAAKAAGAAAVKAEEEAQQRGEQPPAPPPGLSFVPPAALARMTPTEAKAAEEAAAAVRAARAVVVANRKAQAAAYLRRNAPAATAAAAAAAPAAPAAAAAAAAVPRPAAITAAVVAPFLLGETAAYGTQPPAFAKGGYGAWRAKSEARRRGPLEESCRLSSFSLSLEVTKAFRRLLWRTHLVHHRIWNVLCAYTTGKQDAGRALDEWFTFTELDAVAKELRNADTVMVERARRGGPAAPALSAYVQALPLAVQALLARTRAKPTGELAKLCVTRCGVFHPASSLTLPPRSHSKVFASVVEKFEKAVNAGLKKERKLQPWREAFELDPTHKRPPRPFRMQPKRRADPSSYESQALSNNAAFVGRLKPPFPPDAPRARPRAPPPPPNAAPRRARAIFDFILGAHNYGTSAGRGADKQPAYWPTREVQCCGSSAEIRFLLSQVGPGSNGVEVLGALQHASVLCFDPVKVKASIAYRVDEKYARLLTETDLPDLNVGAVVRFPGCRVIATAADASRV